MDPHRGRGAGENPVNRFEALGFEVDGDAWVDDDPRPLRTTFMRNDSQSILSRNTADDPSFDFGLNPYRGCEHGCSYCYARTYHEYLGYSAGPDFESTIVVKADAPLLLEKELSRRKICPGKIAMSGVTDCFLKTGSNAIFPTARRRFSTGSTRGRVVHRITAPLSNGCAAAARLPRRCGPFITRLAAAWAWRPGRRN